MRFAKLILLTGIVSLASTLNACNTVPAPSGCSELARLVLTTDTEHPQIEDSGDPLNDWRNLALRYSVVLNAANRKAHTGYEIAATCEQRDAQITASQRSWNPFD